MQFSQYKNAMFQRLQVLIKTLLQRAVFKGNQNVTHADHLSGATRHNTGRLQRLFSIALLIALVGLLLMTTFAVTQANRVAQQLGASGHALTQSLRLAKAVTQAVEGTESAFVEVLESSSTLLALSKGLQGGNEDTGLTALSAQYQAIMTRAEPLAQQAHSNARVILEQKTALLAMTESLHKVEQLCTDLAQATDVLVAKKLRENANAPEVSATGRLASLAQRIAKSSNDLANAPTVSSEAVFVIGKDLNEFKITVEALLQGNRELRIGAESVVETRLQLEALIQQYEKTRLETNTVLSNVQGLAVSRQAQTAIVGNSDALRNALEELQTTLSNNAGVGGLTLAFLILAVAFAIVSAIGLSWVQISDSRQRQISTEALRLEAVERAQRAKQTNDETQVAILRLMDELQALADGDLTQQATVTEDITGAIADSVNYTIDELRTLVAGVQRTTQRVVHTSSQVDANSIRLAQAAIDQGDVIRSTGSSVLEMAQRITAVSTSAQGSAQAARSASTATQAGLVAVRNTIEGMHSIREHIQETAKRIKRLGESSQEIGEITDLISDITEQTSVLALNAAIQAASAGEAGRGFSVVAQEVQRLAERSANATRHIGALVLAIQTDTQDAVSAMERSTQGVVAGTQLSDTAGAALNDIEAYSSSLSSQVEQIAESTAREAQLAGGLVHDIERIFSITEQMGNGARVTAKEVSDLATMAQELSASVSRFKLA